MALGVLVRAYSGDVVERGGHPKLGELFDVVVKSEHPLLASVDPYDDTVFNSMQARVVLDELVSLVATRRHHYLVVDGD